MNKITITFFMLFIIAVYPVQDGVTQIDSVAVQKKEDQPVYRPGLSPGTDALAITNNKTDVAVKKIVQDIISDNQKKDARITQLERMWRLEKNRADYLSSITPVHDTTKPFYTITKVLIQQEVPDKKDGGKSKKNEKRVYTVRYDTSGPYYINTSNLVKR